jgi:ABC-type multidrug transport system fused ATPase/permease subunit
MPLFGEMDKTLTFKDVSFKYNALNENVLKNINFTLPLVKGFPSAKHARLVRVFNPIRTIFGVSLTPVNCCTIFHPFFDILGIYTEGSCFFTKTDYKSMK